MQTFYLWDKIFELDSDESEVLLRRVRPLTMKSRAALVLRYVRLN